VVRYGGDSFAVILPDTVLTAALSLANKFNAIIRNYPFAHGEKQPRGKMTISVGLTFLDGHTPEELILCCEKALTHAIQKGGDRVEIFSQQTDETGDIA
jgi:diguanylate cyclase (GGDEF)-like protein